jgi:hypothetical protein
MEDVNMTITYLLQILADAAKGDAKKYGIIPDINGELQKAVRRSKRRVIRLRTRAQYDLGEMDKAKVAATNDHIGRFTRALGKIRNLNLEDCRDLQGIEDFLKDGNRIHEVEEMARKIGQMSSLSGMAYSSMSLGFGVLETHTDIPTVEIDNLKFNNNDRDYISHKIDEIVAFQARVREVCAHLLDISQCARDRCDALNDLSDYFADGVEDLERIQMQAGGDWQMYTLVQKMQIGRAIQVAQLILLLFPKLLSEEGEIEEHSRVAIKKAQDELLKRDA